MLATLIRRPTGQNTGALCANVTPLSHAHFGWNGLPTPRTGGGAKSGYFAALSSRIVFFPSVDGW